VKAAFLDVNDARADREKYINAAVSFQQQRLQEARGEAQQTRDAARAQRQRAVETARAQADSFDRLIDRLEQEASASGTSYAEVRDLAVRRRFMDDLQAILQRVSRKVVLDGDKPADLTIFGAPAD
jgi:membrane protease subunit HflK